MATELSTANNPATTNQQPAFIVRIGQKLLLRFPQLHRPLRYLREASQGLTFSQWCYFLALAWLLFSAGSEDFENNALITVGLITGVGLAREFWHLFHQVWNKTLGKGFLLVLYAATANLALAVAALKINAIAGVEPTTFYFTLGFTTLLTLPFWLVMATVVLLSVALIIGNLWLILGLLLRLLRIKVQVHWEDKVFVVLTMILRFVLIPIFITALLKLVEPYFHQLDVFEQPVLRFNSDLSEADLERIQNAPPQQRRELVQEIQARMREEKRQQLQTPLAEAGDGEIDVEISVMDHLIAGFLYNMETYPLSACEKAPNERSLLLNENLLFVATADDSALGYRFSVRECVVRGLGVTP